jgi:hypothetical protein
MVWYRKKWPLAKRAAQGEQDFEFKVSIEDGLKTKSGASSESRGQDA